MRKSILYFTLMLCVVVPMSSAFAKPPKQGDVQEDGMIFLYREPVEIYWNDWSAKRLSQGKVYISGEGKTVNFNGVVSLNCESASGYFWLAASNGHGTLGMTEADMNRYVPIQAVSAAFNVFCRKQ